MFNASIISNNFGKIPISTIIDTSVYIIVDKVNNSRSCHHVYNFNNILFFYIVS